MVTCSTLALLLSDNTIHHASRSPAIRGLWEWAITFDYPKILRKKVHGPWRKESPSMNISACFCIHFIIRKKNQKISMQSLSMQICTIHCPWTVECGHECNDAAEWKPVTCLCETLGLLLLVKTLKRFGFIVGQEASSSSETKCFGWVRRWWYNWWLQ